MKEWREVFGTEATKPEEFDIIASPTTVYQRRNIRQETRTEQDGKKVSGWWREERELTLEEYGELKLMSEVVENNTSEIVKSVTEFNENEVIDRYTEQLIEEGLI